MKKQDFRYQGSFTGKSDNNSKVKGAFEAEMSKFCQDPASKDLDLSFSILYL